MTADAELIHKLPPRKKLIKEPSTPLSTTLTALSNHPHSESISPHFTKLNVVTNRRVGLRIPTTRTKVNSVNKLYTTSEKPVYRTTVTPTCLYPLTSLTQPTSSSVDSDTNIRSPFQSSDERHQHRYHQNGDDNQLEAEQEMDEELTNYSQRPRQQQIENVDEALQASIAFNNQYLLQEEGESESDRYESPRLQKSIVNMVPEIMEPFRIQEPIKCSSPRIETPKSTLRTKQCAWTEPAERECQSNNKELETLFGQRDLLLKELNQLREREYQIYKQLRNVEDQLQTELRLRINSNHTYVE